MNDIILELRGVKKSFGQTEVLMGIDLTVNRGEFITLLGPSGCGKTTTLRIISGLDMPDGGSIILEGRDVTYIEPDKRDVNMVFQNYALFPHMSVEENIGYGLKLKKRPRREISDEVEAALLLVQLEGYGKRRPNELSGGQRQRVAIARAIVNKPKILLLDEPLGALDLQLRRQMQIELKRLQKQLGITFIYITHDQEEALNMSDRVAVMREGRFEQIGSPAQIYDEPKTTFVAAFVGNANIIAGIAGESGDGNIAMLHSGGSVRAALRDKTVPHGQLLTLAIRSEQIEIARDSGQESGLRGIVKEKSFAGGMLRIAVELGSGEEIIVSRHGINSALKEGERVVLDWAPGDAVPVEDVGP
ncbi:MAG: ABC transporter ATP-binding protein [Oscillospiraceae bacterium]|nr:ABC transporter ATP-binding protein [Oscillospiraceae bacterium]